jgi:hypothetical protein
VTWYFGWGCVLGLVDRRHGMFENIDIGSLAAWALPVCIVWGVVLLVIAGVAALEGIRRDNLDALE